MKEVLPLAKRRTAGFVPYRMDDGTISVFLQMRTSDAPHNPDKLAFFGGALEEGESPEQALIREVREELAIAPRQYSLLGEFEEDVSIVSLFYMEAGEDFEGTIDVREGQYGRFVPEGEILGNWRILENHQRILMTLIRKLKEQRPE